MKQTGRVINKKGDFLEIMVQREGLCGADCDSCQSNCAESKAEKITVLNTIDASAGDFVNLEIDSKAVIMYMFIIYGIPLISLLFGIFLSSILFKILGKNDNQLLSVGIGFIFLLLSYFIVKKIDKKKNNSIHSIKLSKYENN